jgi:predicted nucleotidyltransferase
MTRDFVEMLRALSDAGAEFLIVGAQALAAHGYVRATKDLDLWIEPSPENARRVWRALADFGAPLEQISVEDLSTPGTIFQIGVEPNRIDLITDIGIDWSRAWSNRVRTTLGELEVGSLGRADLIEAKRIAGRPEDLRDIEVLERQ